MKKLYSNLLRKAILLILPLAAAAMLLAYQFSLVNSAGGLTVTIQAGYNLVVDSNVSSPSTYAPRVATVLGKFCNTGTSTISNVYGFIGDFDETNGITSTVGVYPLRWSSDAAFQNAHPLLNTPNIKYRFTHLGGATDARRYIGDLAPGECRSQYWHFTYPMCEANQATPCTLDPVWGRSNDPNDDLWLNFDIWGEGSGGAKDHKTWKMTMRNEISAMANKISPNPDGQWFKTNASGAILPGDIITSNGVRYDLGTINQGFDNDGDFIYDYNVWMQPIGDPSFDPTCFRLIRTTGVLTVSRSGGNPPTVLNFVDRLYFTNLPPDNHGAIGDVHYTFLAMGNGCSVSLTPYQEVASGADNEKFNGDFGAGIPPLTTYAAAVSLDKTSTPATVAKGATFTYTLPFANAGNTSAGITLSTGGANQPLVISDTLPAGLSLAAGPARCVVNGVSGACSIQYSFDSGKTYTTTAPVIAKASTAPDNMVKLRWWLNAPLQPGQSGYAQFNAIVPGGYAGTSFIQNTGCAGFGDGNSFTCKSVVTAISGNNRIGDWVWRDANSDGLQQVGETSLPNISVELFWDKNGDQKLDVNDVPITITSTNSAGVYSFPNLGDGRYLVEINEQDPDLASGLFPTTSKIVAVDLDSAGASSAGVTYLTADFGFGPILRINKRLASTNPVRESGLVTYTIDLINTRPGNGTGKDGKCTYTTWANKVNASTDLPASGTGVQAWTNGNYARYEADGLFADANLSNNNNLLGLAEFFLAPKDGAIEKVELVMHLREFRDAGSTDSLVAQLYFNNVAYQTVTKTWTGLDLPGGTGTSHVLTWDVTSLQSGGWTWSMFANDYTEVLLNANPGSGSTKGDFGLDSIGFLVTTTAGDCGGSHDTILTVPLTDTFDADLLRFLRASPTQNSTTTTGTAPDSLGRIFWNNLGPLYAGQTKSVSVTFKALEPGASAITTTNYVSATQARMADGRAVNKAYSNAGVNITPTGSISGRIFSQGSGGDAGWAVAPPASDPTTGWDSYDIGIPNAKVTLYACMTGSTLLGLPAPTPAKTCSANGGAWTSVLTSTTSTDGWYSFDGLQTGWYYVKVITTTLPSATPQQTADPLQVGTPPGQTCSGATCDSLWGNPSATISDANFNSLNGAEDIANVSFGYVINPSIYGTIWRDSNASGTQQAGETGLSGVQVQAFTCGANGICGDGDDGSAVKTVTTAADGSYKITDLVSGTKYYVKVSPATLPSGGTWAQTFDPDAGTTPCSAGECNHMSAGLTVATGNIYGPINFAYTQSGSASLGDTLFKDWNGNGVQDTGDPGIANVTLLLYRDANGDGVIDPLADPLKASVSTDASGRYSFTNLPDGVYVIKVDAADPDLPSGYLQTYDADGTKDGQTGKIVVSGGSVASINGSTSMCAGNCATAVDFGYLPVGFGSIGDTIFRDANANGVQDMTEPGLANIGVQLWSDSNGNGLLDSSDALISTTQSASGGAYLFPNLPAGNFLVAIENLAESDIPTDGYGNRYVITTDDSLSSNGSDNNPMVVSLATGQNYTLADFGFGPGAVLGNTIWSDNNGDGLLDQFSEKGIPNVTVQIYYDSNRNEIIDNGETISYTRLTNSSGEYIVSGMPAGSYVVKVVTSSLPNGATGWTLTGDPDAPTTPCASSYCDNTFAVTLRTGQTDLSADFGYKPASSIGDFVWLDNDGDGVQDTGEPGLRNVILRLAPPAAVDLGKGLGVAVTATTDTSGKYSFGGLGDGSYTLSVISPPSGVSITYDRDGTPDGSVAFAISNGSVSNIAGAACSSPACTNTQFDFGYRSVGSSSISGTIFFDALNNGGNFNPLDGDKSIGNVTLYLYNSVNQLIATTTAISATGRYSFTNLPDGSYNVVVNTARPQINGLGLTATPQYLVCSGNPCDNSALVTLSGASLTNQDFGFFAEMDCGDLPDTYNVSPYFRTTLSVEGPCHVRQAGDSNLHYLGTAWDSESDGQPNIDASGDDHATSNDEDGFAPINFASWAPGTTQQIQLNVSGTNTYVAGWFDWNNNRTFVDPVSGLYDPGEYIYFGLVSPGGQTFNVNIPGASGCCTSQRILYLRIRAYEGFSPPPVIAPGGTIIDGEVEDYQLGVPPLSAGLGEISAHVINRQVSINWQTLQEYNLSGFNIYRSVSPSGTRIRLNSEMIVGQGVSGMLGANYLFIDDQVEPGKTYTYWIELIGPNGSQFSEPLQVAMRMTIFMPVINK